MVECEVEAKWMRAMGAADELLLTGSGALANNGGAEGNSSVEDCVYWSALWGKPLNHQRPEYSTTASGHYHHSAAENLSCYCQQTSIR